MTDYVGLIHHSRSSVTDSNYDSITCLPRTHLLTSLEVFLTLFDSDFLNTGICGTQMFSTSGQSRIVNGVNADEGEWPWIASFRDANNGHRCGASLLNEEWALTAAHCM